MTHENVQLLKPHRHSLSQQTQLYLRNLIEAGTYQPGEQLPSQNELAAELGISRPTLREALYSLEQEGAIIQKQGVGTFVQRGYGERLESGLERLESILRLTARQGLDVGLSDLQIETQQAGQRLSDVLQISPGTNLTAVRRVITVDGKPVAFMLDVVPVSILALREIDESFAGSVLDLLMQKPNVTISRAVADIVAVNADADLADRLQVDVQQALLLLEETLLSSDGIPMGFSRNYFVPEYFQFHVVRR